MSLPPSSPGPWAFAETLYGLRHCLVDRDGRVIGTNLPLGNGPLLEQAPAMVALLHELAAGASVDSLRGRAAKILTRVDKWRSRELERVTTEVTRRVVRQAEAPAGGHDGSSSSAAGGRGQLPMSTRPSRSAPQNVDPRSMSAISARSGTPRVAIT